MHSLSAVLWVRMNPAVGPVVFGRLQNELGDFPRFCIFLTIFTSNILGKMRFFGRVPTGSLT